ncbi:MAG: hypothetical protein Q8S13_03925, partial [Dehalococcoidia bacterium]|nr:hypothetical protein [Dehalococcoidia bacterium]
SQPSISTSLAGATPSTVERSRLSISSARTHAPPALAVELSARDGRGKTRTISDAFRRFRCGLQDSALKKPR